MWFGIGERVCDGKWQVTTKLLPTQGSVENFITKGSRSLSDCNFRGPQARAEGIQRLEVYIILLHLLYLDVKMYSGMLADGLVLARGNEMTFRVSPWTLDLGPFLLF